METIAFAAIQFGLGGITNHLAKAGCFIGGLKAPQVDAGPILFDARGGEKAGDFQHGLRPRESKVESRK
jgi:hypothetical protein